MPGGLKKERVNSTDGLQSYCWAALPNPNISKLWVRHQKKSWNLLTIHEMWKITSFTNACIIVQAYSLPIHLSVVLPQQFLGPLANISCVWGKNRELNVVGSLANSWVAGLGIKERKVRFTGALFALVKLSSPVQLFHTSHLPDSQVRCGSCRPCVELVIQRSKGISGETGRISFKRQRKDASQCSFIPQGMKKVVGIVAVRCARAQEPAGAPQPEKAINILIPDVHDPWTWSMDIRACVLISPSSHNCSEGFSAPAPFPMWLEASSTAHPGVVAALWYTSSFATHLCIYTKTCSRV